jgi:multiple sugar transport system permease protein
MNWGVTTALAIITFIGAWNSFLWPFLAAQNERMMTVTVGITAVQDTFGVAYARVLSGAVLTEPAGGQRRVAYLLVPAAGDAGDHADRLVGVKG